MIITRISGGIGNQLFQYAIARTLSLKNNDELALDTHFFSLGLENRAFKLDRFAISGKKALPSDFKKVGIPDPLNKTLFTKIQRKVFKKIEDLKSLENRKIIQEPAFPFMSEIKNLKGSRYLSGVWQSEKYFIENADIIRKEITLKDAPSEFFKNWALKITQSEAVSLHVRRGDYVHSKKKDQKLIPCDISYYEKSVKKILAEVQNPTFFIFSDDIEWVKKNIKIENPLFFVSAPSAKFDHEELILMSLCKHNIIANSTFSWWGAWLNQNKEKKVIAPEKWFATDKIDTKDLLPEDWIKL